MKFYFAVLLLLASPASAQFTETLEVRVLEIEATVVDRDQNAIEGLTPADFIVTIDGRPATITNFSSVVRGTMHDQAITTAVPTRLIVVIDDMSLHQEPKQRALRALRKYVDETMDPSTTATLITWNGALTTRTTPTTRRELLRSAIDASAKEIPRGLLATTERQQLEAARRTPGYARMAESYAQSRAVDAERTLNALEDVVARAAGAVEGRKIVLFISEGVPMQPGSEMLATLPGSSALRVLSPQNAQGRRFREFAKHAQEAGVVFSTLDPSTSTSTFQHEGMVLLARETGGTLVANQNDLDRALARLDERLSTYYSIAVRPPESASANPRVEVSIKNQPKLRVHVATRSGLPSRDEAIANAVRAQLSWRNEENPLHARLFVELDQHETGCIAALRFLVPSESLELLPPQTATRGQLDFWFAVVNEKGTESPVKMLSVPVTSRHGATIPHTMPLALSSGQYVVSTAVVDRLKGTMSYLQREVACGN